MTYENNENKLIVSLEGRVDTNNAQNVCNDLFDIIDKENPDEIVIDAKDLVYISSAGLRVMLKLSKAYKNFSIVNTSKEVYDIFSVTGFTSVMKVEKVDPENKVFDAQKDYRVIDISDLEVFRQDNDGDVYELPDDKMLKVYNRNCSEEYIDSDKETVNKLLRADIPVMIASEKVKVSDGRIGVIFIK